MSIKRLGPGDDELCRQAAILHIASIHHGLLPLLGDRFLAKLYLHIAAAPEAGVWALADGERLVGFIAGCASIPNTFRWVLLQYGFALAWAAGPTLLRPSVLARLYSILAYPFRRRDPRAEIPALEAELLAIAIDAKEYGQGHGKKLIQAFEASLREWNVRAYRVLTNAADRESNAFYRAIGFTPAGTVRHHALTLQVYEKMIGASASACVFP